MLCIFVATTGEKSKLVWGQEVNDAGSSPMVINKQNYGYILTKVRDVRVATYVAKMVFHVKLPAWGISFHNSELPCNTSEYRGSCMAIRGILEFLRDMRLKVQTHVQTTVKHVHEVAVDLPAGKMRQKRGIFTNFLSSVTGLATKDQLQSLREVLERVEVGIHKSVEMFGKGSQDLVASFQITQNRLDNVADVLKVFRKSILGIQNDLVRIQSDDRSGIASLCEVLRWLRKSQDQIEEADHLYTAMQMLMSGSIPHFLISHDAMANSLIQIEQHLQNTDPHMTLVRHDFGYYYNSAPFRTFIVKGKTGTFNRTNFFDDINRCACDA